MIARAIAQSRIDAANNANEAATKAKTPERPVTNGHSRNPSHGVATKAHHTRGSSMDSLKSGRSVMSILSEDSKVSKYDEFLSGRSHENVGSSAPFKYLLSCTSGNNGDVFTSRDLRTILLQLSLFKMQLSNMIASSKAADEADLLISWKTVYEAEEMAFEMETKTRLKEDQIHMREQLRVVEMQLIRVAEAIEPTVVSLKP